MSVGEWLNSVIQHSDGEDEPYGRPHQNHRERNPAAAPQRREGGPYRDADRNERHGRLPVGDRYRDADQGGRPEYPHHGGPFRTSGRDEPRAREGGLYRDSGRDERYERRDEPRREDNPYRDAGYAEPYQPRRDDPLNRDAERDEQQEHRREAKPAPVAERESRDAGGARGESAAPERPRDVHEEIPRRNEFNEVNARLDKLAQQLEHLARVAATPPAPAPQPVDAPRQLPDPPLTGGPTPVRKAQREPLHAPLAVAPPPSPKVASEPRDPPLAAVPPRRRRANAEPAISIDDAVAEIAARQRVLDGGPAIADEATGPAEAQAPEPAPALTPLPVPVLDFDSLEQQLRQITARIEALQPSQEIEKTIAALRGDLAEIGKQLNEALPRRALDSLESEIKALGARIDFSRQAGVDPNALAGLERGLAEVREALRGLTPAENLIGADAAVHALAEKVDMILARDDPAMLQQLEAAIGGLRGVVSHVASNDTLNKVAEDVRVLAAQVDAIANNAATAHAVASLEQRIDMLTAALHAASEAGQAVPRDSADNAATAHAMASLEQRIDTLAAALHAASEAGQAVPRDLEKMLAGLIDKLEWVQLTHTDHAALGHLEDRIAMLVKRFDASEARFGQLEAIERGLADLLVHVEQMRGTDRAAAVTAAPAAWHTPAAPAFDEPVAEIKHGAPGTHDAPATMRDTVEHVADRLAMIESNVYDSAAATAPTTIPPFAEPSPAPQHAVAHPIVADEIVSLLAGAPAAPIEAATATAAAQPATRPPLDPTLPPDHPLEVGFSSSHSRPNASAAERVAASEAAIGSAKPPVIPDAGRPNFIAAARRAAQAASWEPSTAKVRREPEPAAQTVEPSKLSQRLRKLVVAGSALLIVVGCARIAMRLLDGHTAGSPPPMQSEQIAAPAAPTPVPPAQKSAPANAPAAQVPAPQLPNPPGAAAPGPAPAPAKTVKPEQQSLQQERGGETFATATPPAGGQPGANTLPLWATPDITGTLPRSIAGPQKPRAAAPVAAASSDDLPEAIGDPALRAAANGGDPAAAYEVAARFAEGRDVAKNSTAAAHWLERAAKQGLAPAQFRLGGLYEKGIGVKKDLAAARELYLAAAEKGNGKAMHNLAVLYAEGIDGAPDYTTAAEWFRRGADHGLSDSQYNLGILYARGIGVKQNYAESYKWFALAANQGDQDAAGKRDEVAGHLDAQALAAARATVQNFKAEPQPDEAINVKTAAAWQAPAIAQAPAKTK